MAFGRSAPRRRAGYLPSLAARHHCTGHATLEGVSACSDHRPYVACWFFGGCMIVVSPALHALAWMCSVSAAGVAGELPGLALASGYSSSPCSIRDTTDRWRPASRSVHDRLPRPSVLRVLATSRVPPVTVRADELRPDGSGAGVIPLKHQLGAADIGLVRIQLRTLALLNSRPSAAGSIPTCQQSCRPAVPSPRKTTRIAATLTASSPTMVSGHRV